MRPQLMQFIHLTTLDSVQHLYQNDPSALIPFLHPDITWIRSTDNQCLTGKASVSKALSAFSCIPTETAGSLSCRVLYCGRTSCTLLCTCLTGHHKRHCITFVWKEDQGRPRVIHIHGSITPISQSSSGLKPLLSEQGKETCLVFTGRHAERYYLNPGDILYVEADNISSRLICENRTLHICQPLSAVQQLLPDCFIRIHRSFLINAHYITALRRYMIELQGRITLPVPEKKYKWLKEYLDQHRESPGL